MPSINSILTPGTSHRAMDWRLTAQSCGSIIVVGSFAASEAAAWYLSAHPGSGCAWYMNLEVFRPFELARSGTSPLRLLFGPASLAIALGLLGVLALLHIRQLRWGVAMAANLSFVFAAFLAHSWSGVPGATRAAALGNFADATSGDHGLVVALLAVSFLSVAVSHLAFLGRVGTELGQTEVARA